MTNEQILKKAIEKAIKNGFYIGDRKVRGAVEDEGKIGIWVSSDVKCDLVQSKHYFIFSHDFAKTFWGKKPFQLKNNKMFPVYKTKIPWKYHLQQMVLEKEPIKYLEKFL